MKVHVQFLEEKLNGLIDDALGSDGVFILDGRNSLETMKADATDRMNKLNTLHRYVGFSIRRGPRFDQFKEIYNTQYTVRR